jgi:hypothetical protein
MVINRHLSSRNLWLRCLAICRGNSEEDEMRSKSLVDWKELKKEYLKILKKYEILNKEFKGLENYFPKNKWIEIPINLYPWDFLSSEGVYVIFSSIGNIHKPIYIGSSQNIGQRLLGQIDRRLKFRLEEKRISKIKIKRIKANPNSEPCSLERNLILKLRPKGNKQILKPTWNRYFSSMKSL